jgi:septal ring factor EnvC (AmiA/AmiB activator)
MDPAHWNILIWVGGIQSASSAALLGAIYFVARCKADNSSVNMFITSCKERLASMSEEHHEVKERQVGVLQRVTALEEGHKSLEKSIVKIEEHITSVDRKVHEMNGGVMEAMRQFREAIQDQMRVNQEILLHREKARGEEV